MLKILIKGKKNQIKLLVENKKVLLKKKNSKVLI